ncbi:MAG TPA: non-homologous end-joining DNA ligase [Opitutaceae bacterium]|jgi:bifunctional non-homologous end joining protein LigD|nr:non-homologous end-joining DNA ligase [Opitutaceae bacterium]
MKALGVSEVPKGRWHCEIKYDGYRAIAAIEGAAVQLWSRNRNSLVQDYPEVVEALRQLNCGSAVLDGEIVALDEKGRSHFQLLQQRTLARNRPPIVYYLFDLPELNGRSLISAPIEERQRELAGLLGRHPTGVLRLSPVFDLAPARLLARVRKEGLEGIMLKAPASAYEPDRRSGAWLKCRIASEQEFVIGGFTPPRGGRAHFGAILAGYFQDGDLRYAGKVGTGYDRRLLEELHELFLRRRAQKCPFADLPQARRPRFGAGMTETEMRKVTWLKPGLVAQIRFAEWTEDGLLRQPVFLGLRKDKPARAVVREAAALTPRG